MKDLLVVGQLSTTEGKCFHYDRAGDLSIEWLAANHYLRNQPRVAVTVDHDDTWRVGETEALRRGKQWGLLGAATVREDMVDLLISGAPWYWSPRVACNGVGEWRLESAEMSELTLTQRPACRGVRPICFGPSDGWLPPMPLGWDRVWEQGKEAKTRRRYHLDRGVLQIHDEDPLSAADEWISDPEAALAYRAEIADLAARRRAADARAAAAKANETMVPDRVYRHHLGGRVVGFD